MNENAKHTPGPWAWFGGGNGVYLATTHSGRRFVMDFVRRGMHGAQPRFQSDKVMVDAADLCQFVVGDRDVRGFKEARKNRSVYRYDVSGIDHPDARLIASAPTLAAENERLKALVADMASDLRLVARLTEELHDSPKSLHASLTDGLPSFRALIARAKGAAS